MSGFGTLIGEMSVSPWPLAHRDRFAPGSSGGPIVETLTAIHEAKGAQAGVLPKNTYFHPQIVFSKSEAHQLNEKRDRMQLLNLQSLHHGVFCVDSSRNPSKRSEPHDCASAEKKDTSSKDESSQALSVAGSDESMEFNLGLDDELRHLIKDYPAFEGEHTDDIQLS
eukprot:GHVN01037010.1.p1 GENE.GHVN01037010.1~~GHVN01037010.1.p1  ORF type:complete len:167 (+),score=19.75 GHVN01037010.1:592-1092(+)